MKRLFTVFAVSVLAVLVFSTDSMAQREKAATAASSIYVISAKAGAVNYTSGKVLVEKQNAKSGYLVKGDDLDAGDKVKTDSTSKAEILLNPGSYVRLSENAVFEFKDTSLDNIQVKLSAGSAIFEVMADNNFQVAVGTPKIAFYLVKSGIYRVDVGSDGIGKISVWKGKAQLNNNTVIKAGQTTAIVNGQLTVAKFDRDNKGEFETWSKDRAKEIAKINARLVRKEMNRSLINGFNQNLFGTGLRNAYGFWVMDGISRSYCFLPFGYGWSSPYGFGFDSSIWSYNVPMYTLARINPIVANVSNQITYNQQQQNNNASNPFPASQQNSGGGYNPGSAGGNAGGVSAPVVTSSGRGANVGSSGDVGRPTRELATPRVD